MAKICFFVFYLAACALSADLEPAPDMEYSTTAAAVVTYQHTVNLAISLNLAGMTHAALVQQIKNSMPNGGGTVAVTISKIDVETTMENLPSPCNITAKVQAFANMCDVNVTDVTLTCGTAAGGRRLQTLTGSKFVVAMLPSAGGDALVTSSKGVSDKITTTAFTSALKAVAPTEYASLNASSLTAETTSKVAVTSVITSTNSTAPSSGEVMSGIEAGITGATVSGVSVTTISTASTTAGVTTGMEESSAQLASVMAAWAIAYGFLMN